MSSEKMRVRDLLEEHTDAWGIKEKLLQGACVALSSRTGKKLFDTRTNKREYVEKFYDREVMAIWSSIISVDSGFNPYIRAVTKIYISDPYEGNE